MTVLRRTGSWWRWCWIVPVAFGLLAAGLCAKEVMPPAPRAYVNDYAGIMAPAAARQLNAELENFERTTSNQLVVAIYPKMQSDSSIEDYTVRVAQSWHVGTKKHSNGAVLFIFVQDHKMFIETGYGLEGALPDALCKRIVDDVIIPRFKAGDDTAGIVAGVHAMMAATRGEYKGTGRTQGGAVGGTRLRFNPFSLLFIILIIGGSLFSRRRNSVYHRAGRNIFWFGGPWGGGGWGGGGGGGFGGGFGGFSGGGGSFGGGGAGGSW